MAQEWRNRREKIDVVVIVVVVSDNGDGPRMVVLMWIVLIIDRIKDEWTIKRERDPRLELCITLN